MNAGESANPAMSRTGPQRSGPSRNIPVRLVTFHSPKEGLTHTLGS
jgi:hypothetical protein